MREVEEDEQHPLINPEYRAAADKYGVDFDVTQLRQGGHGRTIHRDYLAHCMRWGWIARHVHFGDVILDAGCGQDVSLYDVLAGTKTFLPSLRNPESRARPIYVGVDLNKIKKATGASWAYVEGEVNLTDLDKVRSLPHAPGAASIGYDWITSFEVIEHMAPHHGDTYLENLRDVVSPSGHLVLSTPVFNGRAAKNHIHEYGVEELQLKLEQRGWKIKSRWGSFASWNPIIQELENANEHGTVQLLTELRDYLGPEATACFLAPLYPDASRNNVWVCAPR